MNWNILSIAIVFYLCTFCLKNIHGAEILSCKKDQKCLQYRKCQPAVKIAKQILATSDVDEKSRLTSEFKTLRCGNFFIEKTVCCDQDQIQEPYYSKNMISNLSYLISECLFNLFLKAFSDLKKLEQFKFKLEKIIRI